MDREEIVQLTIKLAEFLNNRETIYLTWEGNLDDFTRSFEGTLQIHTKDQFISLFIPAKNVMLICHHLLTQIFAENKLVICWDVKKLFSYLRFHSSSYYEINIEAKVIDLKLIEAFVGIHGVKPQNWAEAIERVRPLAGNKHLPIIRQRLYVPLATKVIPAIETAGLLDVDRRTMRYSSYEIEGQVNGRLCCDEIHDNFFNPHTLGDEKKKKFRAGNDKKFVVFDYKSMEVSVLHWMSQDAHLGGFLNSAQDLYHSIYEVISGRRCKTAAHREFAKDVFLPIIFGQQAQSLAERHDISISGAKLVIDRIYAAFPVALAWVKRAVDEVRQSHVLTDYFGRTRRFDERFWAVRNAVVQGPAAMICLDKLVTLFDRKPTGVTIVASVHDGYILTVNNKTAEYDIDVMREILQDNHASAKASYLQQEPSEFYPGLSLRVGTKTGDNLSNLTPVGIL